MSTNFMQKNASSIDIHRKLNMTQFTMATLTHEAIQSGREMGLNEDQAQTFGIISAAITSVSQLIMPDYKFIGGSKLMNSMAGKSLVEKLKQTTTKSALNKVKNGFIVNNLRELAEEEIDFIFQDGLKQTYHLNNFTHFQDWTKHQDLIAGTLLISLPLGSYGSIKQYRSIKKQVINQVKAGLGYQALVDMEQQAEHIRLKIDKMERLDKVKFADRIKALKGQGMGATAIAKEMGIDRTSVYRLLKK